jgi:multidrug efflux pump subunit AcrA (membrane-fusion protein)
MRSSLRTAIVIGVMLVVLAGVGVLALWGFGGQRPAVASIEKIQARQGVPVHVSGLERRSFTDYVLCDGNVAADVRALLRSKIEEIVEDVSVRVGEPVSKGRGHQQLPPLREPGQ